MPSKKQAKDEQFSLLTSAELLVQMKQWLHSLSEEELQDAMSFPLGVDVRNKSESIGRTGYRKNRSDFLSSSQHSSSTQRYSCPYNNDEEINLELRLLRDMLDLQSPPPTPIHPKAMGFKLASDTISSTTGRFNEEERVKMNRFRKPRLFQFVEKSSVLDTGMGKWGKEGKHGLATLPPDIVALVRCSEKVTTSSPILKRKRRMIRGMEYDVLAKRFITPCGEILSLGCTQEQREADLEMMLGTRIHHGCLCSTKASDSTRNTELEMPLFCTFHRPNNVSSSNATLRILHVVSRGKFLSRAFIYPSEIDDESIAFPPWFCPTEEWFSLPKYLSSRFETSLWYRFRRVMTGSSSKLSPRTIIAEISMNIDESQLKKCLFQSICLAFKREIFQDESLNGNLRDLRLQNIICPDTCSILETFLLFGRREFSNVQSLLFSLTHICIVDFGTILDKIRLFIVKYLQEALTEEAKERLLRSIDSGQNNAENGDGIGKRRKKRKKRKNREKKKSQSILHAIDELKGDGSTKNRLNALSPVSFGVNPLPSAERNVNTIIVLGLLNDMYEEAFGRLGFPSEESNGYKTTALCRKAPQGSKGYYLKTTFPKKKPGDDEKGQPLPISVSTADLLVTPLVERIDLLGRQVGWNPSDGPILSQLTMKRNNLTRVATPNAGPSFDKVTHSSNQGSSKLTSAFNVPDSQISHNQLHDDNDRDSPSLSFLDQPISSSHSVLEIPILDPPRQRESPFQNLGNGFFDTYSSTMREQSLMANFFDSKKLSTWEDKEQVASSTAASIASSTLDSDIRSDLQDDIVLELAQSPFGSKNKNSKSTVCDFAVRNVTSTSNSFSVQVADNEMPPYIADSEEQEKDTTLLSDVQTSSLARIGEQGSSSSSLSQNDNLPPALETPITPPPQLSPIQMSLAEIKKLRQRATSFEKSIEGEDACSEKDDLEKIRAPMKVAGSLPSSPKIVPRPSLTTSWSREDLRISPPQNDKSDDITMNYRNAAIKGTRRAPSVASFDHIDVFGKHRPRNDSIRYLRSGASLNSYMKEVIIDGHIELKTCAQSESALDAHEDSSHWNVIPKLDSEDADNISKDGATTISSFLPSSDTEEVTFLREQRNAYRDMCLTLGAEIATLNNKLAVGMDSYAFIPPNRTPEFINSPSLHPSYYQNNQRAHGNRIVAMSDIGHEIQMSEDGTDMMQESVVTRSTSIGHLRAPSIGGTDGASLEHGTALNMSASRLMRQEESFGPEHLHGLQSRLSMDIISFVSSVETQLEKQHERRAVATKRFRALVTALWPRAQVKVYGSHVCNLCLPSSDLDFVVCLPAVHKNIPADTPGALEGRNAINESNQKLLARKLKSESWIGEFISNGLLKFVFETHQRHLSYVHWLDPRTIKLIDRTALPLIKVSTKDTKAKTLQLDITFDSPGHHGLEAIQMVKDVIEVSNSFFLIAGIRVK